MKLKIWVIIPLLFFYYNVNAESKSIHSWIKYFDTHAIKIFYSSDFVSDETLDLSIELEEDRLLSFNQGLQLLSLNLLKIDDSTYVIQPIQNTKQYKNGLIIQVIDSETHAPINNFTIILNNSTTVSKNSYILLNNTSSDVSNFKVSAVGYQTKVSPLTYPNNKYQSIIISLNAKPINLNTVIVTASQFNINHTKNSQSYIDASDIENHVSITNDPLTSINNIAGNSSNGISGKTKTRGGNENESLIVLDNNILRNPYHFKDFFSTASIINSSFVDGIDFYSGVFPAQFGDKLSSVIQINSGDNIGKPSYEIGADALNINGSFRYSNEDFSKQFLASVRSGGRLIKSKLVEDSIVKPEFDDAYIKLSQQLNNRWVASQHLLLSQDDLNFEVGNKDEANSSFEQSHAEYQDQNLWMQWNYDNQESVQSNIMFYYSHKKDYRNGQLDNNFSLSSIDEDIETSYYGLKYSQILNVTGKLNLDYGLDVFHEKTNINSLRNINQDGELLQQLGLIRHENRFFEFNNTGTGTKVYISSLYQINPKLIFDMGLHFEYKDWMQENIKSPRFNLAYFYNDSTTFRLGLGRHQQSQHIDELLLEDEDPKYFKPSSADVAVFEYNKQFSNSLVLRAELYEKEYSHTQPYYENIFDSLHILPDLYYDRSRITPSDSSARGMEVTLSGRFNKIDWSGSYIFSDVEDEFEEVNIDGSDSHQTQARSWDQHHAFKFNLHIPINTWFIDIIGNYHSGWPKTNLIESNGIFQIGERNNDNFNDHLQFDLKLSKHLKTQNGLLKISLQANNLFNTSNICCVNYDSVDNQLTIKEKQWLPIVPNFSVNYYWD